jgi:hypothetical protein
MRRTPLIGAAVSLCLLLAATACGESDGESRDDLVSDLSETLQQDGDGLSEKDADCVAGVIVDDVGVDALKDVDLSADQPPEELQDEITAAAARATEECDPASPSG